MAVVKMMCVYCELCMYVSKLVHSSQFILGDTLYYENSMVVTVSELTTQSLHD